MKKTSKLNKYFVRSEFACKCGCGKDTVDAELLLVLTDMREHFNQPVRITSANRCERHNKKIGGAIASAHLTSKASDIVVKNVAAQDVAKYLDDRYPDRYGLGRYNDFTHIDVRPYRARW